jgi:hypothetical protein
MANSISGFNTFVAGTEIQSSPMNSNFTDLIQGAPVWQKYTVAYTNVNTAAAAYTATLYQLDPKECILAWPIL